MYLHICLHLSKRSLCITELNNLIQSVHNANQTRCSRRTTVHIKTGVNYVDTLQFPISYPVADNTCYVNGVLRPRIFESNYVTFCATYGMLLDPIALRVRLQHASILTSHVRLRVYAGTR